MFGDECGALAVEIGIVRRPCRQAVDVAVAEAEHGGDEHGVVNLEIRRPERASTCDVCRGHQPAALGRLAGDDQQRLELVGDGRAFRIALDVEHQRLVAAEVVRGDRAMDRLAVAAVVARRHVGRNQLALAGRERVRSAQQHVNQLVERLGGLRPKGHRTPDPGQVFLQLDVCHGVSAAP